MTNKHTGLDAKERARVFDKDVNDRDYDDAIKVGKLKTFVEAGVKGSGKAWNCLDLPQTNQEVPAAVR